MTNHKEQRISRDGDQEVGTPLSYLWAVAGAAPRVIQQDGGSVVVTRLEDRAQPTVRSVIVCAYGAAAHSEDWTDIYLISARGVVAMGLRGGRRRIPLLPPPPGLNFDMPEADWSARLSIEASRDLPRRRAAHVARFVRTLLEPGDGVPDD